MRDRYKRIQDPLERRDSCELLMLGIGGEVGEPGELLMDVGQARDGVFMTKATERTVKREHDEDKDQIGTAIIASAARRKLCDTGCSPDAEETGPAREKSKAKSVRAAPSIEMAAFSSNLRDAYFVGIKLDRERSQL